MTLRLCQKGDKVCSVLRIGFKKIAKCKVGWPIHGMTLCERISTAVLPAILRSNLSVTLLHTTTIGGVVCQRVIMTTIRNGFWSR